MQSNSNYTLADLQEQMKPWIDHNFPNVPVHQPILGLIEETGELSHAILKKAQGIRGTPEELDEKARDAVGDIIIYLGHFCNITGQAMKDPTYREYDVDTVACMMELASNIGSICELYMFTPNPVVIHTEYATGDIPQRLLDLCVDNEWDFFEIVKETWEHVSGRDWVARPETGK